MTKIYLPLTLMLQLLKKIKIKIILLILSAIIVSKKSIILTNILKKSQKTSISLGNLYINN